VHADSEKKPVSPGRRGGVVIRATTPNALALQKLREELDPYLQRIYPEMLTSTAPPTRDDILDVMIKLQAVTPSGRYVAEIAMEIITSLVAMIDVDQLEPGEPANYSEES